MTTKWIEDWEQRLAEISLTAGAHDAREKGVCVMEAVAWLRDQNHTDHPACVSPMTRNFMMSWNDGLPSDAERNRLLKPLLPVIVDTVADEAVELRRSYMALDWLVRVHAPAFLGLTDSLKAHAVALSGLAPLTNTASCKKAQPLLDAARAASWDAAWAAAGDAARDASWDAAWAAARAAAGAASWDAAWDAAWNTAGAALKPTVQTLQESASELVRRMAAAK